MAYLDFSLAKTITTAVDSASDANITAYRKTNIYVHGDYLWFNYGTALYKYNRNTGELAETYTCSNGWNWYTDLLVDDNYIYFLTYGTFGGVVFLRYNASTGAFVDSKLISGDDQTRHFAQDDDYIYFNSMDNSNAGYIGKIDKATWGTPSYLSISQRSYNAFCQYGGYLYYVTGADDSSNPASAGLKKIDIAGDSVTWTDQYITGTTLYPSDSRMDVYGTTGLMASFDAADSLGLCIIELDLSTSDPTYTTRETSSGFYEVDVCIADSEGFWVAEEKAGEKVSLKYYADSHESTGDGTLPSLAITAGSNGVVESLPVPTITAGCSGVVESLPLFSLVNCYVDVPHADVDESLPVFTISATAIQDTVITGDCTLPVLTISALTGYQTEGELEVDLPVPTASASSLTGEIHEGDCDVPFFTISATLLAGGISQGVATLPTLTFTGRTINTGTASESVPIVTISAYAHGPLLHTLDETLPLLQIVATLVQQSTAFRCYVMNTENSAITEYDNFPFNSFCTFKGKHLAAGANGIMLLEGNKDLSRDIQAYLNVGNNDFDLPNIKRITDAYLSMKGDGSYYLTVTSDDGVAHSYLLSTTTGDRIKNLKTNVGKGKKGRFFELELSNLAGADFELYDMVLNVELLKRNI